MHIGLEEEVVLLYALYVCGRKPSKARATQFILTNHLLKSYGGDWERVATGEHRVENRIAFTRQNLKDKGDLLMPDRGTWAITQKGAERIEKVALKSLTWEEPKDELDIMLHEIKWDRFSDEFLKRLKSLGAELKKRREKIGEQCASPNGGPAMRLGNSGVAEGPPSVS